MTDDVLAKQENNQVKGEVLIYDEKTNVATFPDFADFSGDNLDGNAQELHWDLNKNLILGSGDVEVFWQPSKKPKP